MNRNERVIKEAELVISGMKIRTVADKLGISKSTIQRDLAVILPKIHPSLYNKVVEELRFHKSCYFKERRDEVS